MNKILDIKIDNLTLSQTMQKIADFLKSDGLHQICTVNPEFIMAAQKDSEFKEVLNAADLSVPDGVGLQMAAFFKRIKIGKRLTGVDLTWEIAKLAAENGYSIFLLGGGEGVAEMTTQRLRYIYRDLKIAGVYTGSPEEEGTVERINESKTDILLVAFGAPKQDKFIYQHRKKLKCKIAIGVGGTFDYISEMIPRAPKWLRSLGLEWLYRLVKQPSRFKRICTAVIKFPLTVIFSRSQN